MNAGALAGLLAGFGLALLAGALPRRRPTLAARLDPYLRPYGVVSPRSPLAPTWAPGRLPGPLARLAAAAAPAAARAVAAVDQAVGGRESVRRRLLAAGSPLSVEGFRQQQVLAGASGGLLGAALLGLRLSTGVGLPPTSLLGLVVLLTAAGFTGWDAMLTRAVRRREAAMLAELPGVAELLALAVGAGEAPAAALARVVRVTRGALAGELSRALSEVRTGTPFAEALAGVSGRSGLAALGRLTDAVAVAVARGTPLAEVLHAQAADAREAGRRALLEAGGRTEIAMLVPVVFLILPVTVVFALFPGAVTLTTLAR